MVTSPVIKDRIFSQSLCNRLEELHSRVGFLPSPMMKLKLYPVSSFCVSFSLDRAQLPVKEIIN